MIYYPNGMKPRGTWNPYLRVGLWTALIILLLLGAETSTVLLQSPPCTSYSFNLSPSYGTFAAQGGTNNWFSWSKTANTACPSNATPADTWVTITSGGSSSTSAGSAYYAVAVNSSAARNSSIAVRNNYCCGGIYATTLFSISQAGGATCSIQQYAFQTLYLPATSYQAYPYPFTLSSATCAWQAGTSSNFLTLNPPTSGTGSGQFTFNVPAHSGSTRRTADMTLVTGTNTQVSTVVQNPPCSLTTTPATISPGVGGGTFAISVTPSNSQCWWSAYSNDSWITVPSGVNFGPGSFQVTVPASSVARSGSVLINGASQAPYGGVTVNQGGGGISITTQSLPNGSIGVAYPDTALQVTGGAAPYVWSLATGTLPAGLTLSSGGVISGTPVTAGTSSFTVRVTDYANGSATASFTITITGGLTILTTTLPNGVAGSAYPSTQMLVSGGTGPYTWSVSAGTLPPGLALAAATGTLTGTPTAAGVYSFTIRVVDSQGAAGTRALGIVVLGSQPTLTASPAQMSFLHQAGELILPVAQGLSIFSSGPSTSFTLAATTLSGGSWLAVSPSAGRTDQTISVSVPGANTLPPGSYTGTITVTAPGTVPSTYPVSVTLRVDPPRPAQPQLDVTPPEILITGTVGGEYVRRGITVTNTGAGSMQYTLESLGGYARLDSTGGSLGPGASATANLTADPSSLGSGLYQTEIVVRASTGQTRRIPVSLSVSRQPRCMLLSQVGLEFTVIEGGPAPPPQDLAVLNTGLGRMDWIAETQTLPAGLSWLRVSPGRGSHVAGSVPAELLQVSVDSRGLAAGAYYGSVRLLASGTANSPQTVSVRLNVLRSTDTTGPLISRTGMVLVGQSGTVNPPTEDLLLYNMSSRPVSFSSSRYTVDGADWCSQSPSRGVIPAGGTARITVSGSLSSLQPGYRTGTLRIWFDDGTSRTISLSAMVGQAGQLAPQAAASGEDRPQAIPGCRPSRLVPQFTTLEAGFAVTAQQPQGVRVLVKDDCDNPISDGVVTGFLSDEPGQLTFTSEGNGLYGATWIPAAPAANKRIVARAFVSQASQRLGGDSPILTGTIAGANATQSASPARVVNGATLANASQIALGSWVTVFGDRLAEGEAISTDPVYPRKLIGTEVLLGDQPLPLYYVAKGQVNALIPSGLEPNTQHQLLIRRGNTQSVGVPVTVADLQPGIFAMNSQGTGQGAVLIANTGMLAAVPGFIPGFPSRPARPGEILEIYSTGLGLVRNAPPDGTPAPGNPLASTLETPTVSIGGQSAPVLFSGLVPGLIGLYQVNAQIPNVTGNAVPVVLTQRGFTSNTVTVAIQ